MPPPASSLPQHPPGGDLRASRTPLAGFAAMGAIWGALAAMMPGLRAQTGASDAELGVVFLIGALVSVASMLAAPRLGRALGPRALPLAVAAMVAAVLLPGQAGAVWQLGVALAAMGASSAVVDVLMNGRVASIEAARGRPLMNLNHAGYSLSFFAGAVLTGLARDAGATPAPVFAALALALAPLVLLTLDRPPAAARPAGSGPAAAGVVWGIALLGGGVMLLASMLESGTETWSALHLERTLGAGPALAALGPAMLGLCMGLGRLGGQALSRRLGPLRLIAAGGLLAAAGGTLAALAPGPSLALAGLAALGFGASVLIPTALTLIGAATPPDRRTTVIARAYALGFCGYVVGPFLMGQIAEAAGLRWSFLLLALSALAVLPLVAALARRARG